MAPADWGVHTSRKVKRVLERISRGSLMILVWGPGVGDPAYSKRQDIRQEITARFPNAEVHFSEDERLRCLTRDLVTDIPQEELIHALAADLIFCLDTSKGVGEEIAKYSSVPQIARKMIVLSHERYRGARSFAAELRAPLAVEWFSTRDFDMCDLAKAKCPKHVMGWLLSKL